MPVSNFRYTPIPEERRIHHEIKNVNETVHIPKWAGYAVHDFGTKVVAYEDRENWGAILKTFGIAMAMLIIIIAVLLIGLIYLCLRCKGYLNPIRDYAERSNQRCVRCILTLLMLFLLAGLLYFVIMAIKNTVSKRRMQEDTNSKARDDFSSSVTSRQLDHVFGLNYEEFQAQARDSANDLIRNWTGTTDVVSDESKTLCPPAENISDVNKRVAEVNNEFELLCLGVLEWSDYMHFFYRNMTMFMAETDDGRKVLKELDFPNFLSKTMQVEKLLDFYRIFSVVDKFFYSFSKLYNTTINWPENLQSSTENALSPYFLEITKDLGDKGGQFRSLSTTLASRSRGDDTGGADYERAGKEEEDDKAKEPLAIFILDIICYALLLLITVVLLIALLLRCCGKRYRSEARCCNQENGSCLFQFAAFLMFLFLLLVLYPFLWHFVHGAGRYNSVCTRNDTHKYARALANIEDTCLDKKTFKKILDDHVDRKFKLNISNKSTVEDVKPSAPELQKYSISFKQNARATKRLDLKNMCEDIKNRTDPKHLTEVYTQMLSYADGDMPDNQVKMLSQCNLGSFKKRRIDEYKQSVIYKSATRLASYCNRVVEFFTENYAKITGECLNGIESLKNNFSKQSKHELSEIMAGLNNMYDKELDGYVDMATDRVVNKVTLCRKVSSRSADRTKMDCDAHTDLQNVSWSALLMLIWLILPLIPIALYLARLFGTSRGSCCSCEQSGSGTADRRNDRWNTNSVMDEMQRHLYKSLCEDSVRSGPSNGRCDCKAARAAYKQGPSCGRRCLDDGNANLAMLQQANTLLLKSNVCSESTELEKRGILKSKQLKEPQRPTTSKGMRSKRAQQLANDNKSETSSFRKCVCDRNAAKMPKGPSSSMASSRPKKRMRNVCETLEEIVEESTDNGMNALEINASIHILTFNKKMT
uniref:Prominin-like protein n=1 Tax=Bactrocera latifrons TaxID=174628 RepID=A0A0K8UQX3_BACLA